MLNGESSTFLGKEELTFRSQRSRNSKAPNYPTNIKIKLETSQDYKE